MKVLRFLIPFSLVLAISYAIGYLLVTNVSATGGGHHNQWGEWQYGEWSDCQPAGDCGEEGYQVRTRTRTCERTDGHGVDECKAEHYSEWSNWMRGRCPNGESETCDEGWLGVWYYRTREFFPADTQEEEQRQRCRLEEYDACSTRRWCFPCQRGEVALLDDNGHQYCAEAIPANEEPKEGFAWEEGMDRYCEYPEQPEPTPTPEPGEPVEMYSPPEYHAPECTGIGAPKAPTLQLLEVLGGGGITWRVSQTDPYDSAVFRYGYSPDNLEYGIPDLGTHDPVIEFDTFGLEPGQHVWGQVGTERGECYSWSAIVDPVIE